MGLYMPKIRIRFVAQELAPGLEDGEYSFEAGTVRDLIALCASQCAVPEPPEKNYNMMYPMFNGKPATLDSEITEDGTLHVCRIVLGG